MTDKTMTFRIGDDHEDVMKETLTEVFDALQGSRSPSEVCVRDQE